MAVMLPALHNLDYCGILTEDRGIGYCFLAQRYLRESSPACDLTGTIRDKKLAAWEELFYDFNRPNGVHDGLSPYEAWKNMLG